MRWRQRPGRPPERVELISVHVPKAGGTATLSLLGEAYGDALLRDYAGDPADPVSRRQLDPLGYMARRETPPAGVRAVHGHFHPAKYAGIDAAWFAILRRPPEMIVSVHWFWRTAAARGIAGPTYGALHRYAMEHELGIEAVARLPILRRLLSETYFGGFDMTRFDVIGRHEDRATALAALARLTGRPMPPDRSENVTPAREEMGEMLADDRLMRRLEDILIDDVRFYERWAG